MARKGAARVARTKEMLLPLSARIVRCISLENHLSLAAIRDGHGTPDTMIALLRILYMTFLLEAPCGAQSFGLYLEVEAALDESICAAAYGHDWQLPAGCLPAIEAVLRRNDELVGSIAKYRYIEAWEKLTRFVGSAEPSPLPGGRLGEVWK